MSYDLMVFDATAPTSAEAFGTWYATQTDWATSGRAEVPATLARWYHEIQMTFPALNPLPGDPPRGEIPDERLCDYSFGEHVIYLGFAWSVADAARRGVLNTACLNGIGAYDPQTNRVFYPRPCDRPLVAVSHNDLESYGEATLTLYTVLDLFDSMAWTKDSFLSFPLDPERLFQIHGEPDGDLTMEFTHLAENSYLQRRADRGTCRQLLMEVFGSSGPRPDLEAGFGQINFTPSKSDALINRLVPIGFIVVLIALIGYFIYLVIA